MALLKIEKNRLAISSEEITSHNPKPWPSCLKFVVIKENEE